MKTYLHAFAMCQSMFCAIPCPWQVWDEKARDRMLLFLPLVGLELGALWALLAWGCAALGVPGPVRALALTAFPYLATGYIHLDGFMDVTDAVKSCRSPERRREILKDSHVGSFAVICLALVLLTQFALNLAGEGPVWLLALIPGVSRCCSALAVEALPPMSTSQYAQREKNRVRIALLLGMLLVFAGLGFLAWGKYGFALIGCLAGCGLALRRGYRPLGGMNGDIAGYSLTLGELAAVAVWTLL